MYSSIHNMDTSLLYKVHLNGEEVARSVPSHHVDSLVYQLECEGHDIDGVYWNDDELIVELTSIDEDSY